MKMLFVQTAKHKVNRDISSDILVNFPEMIFKHTEWEYSYQQRADGCFLKPTFKNMPYRNSFVPEIDVVVSRHDAQTMLHINGRPVKFVRVFMTLWLGFLLAIEAFLFALVITSDLKSIFPVFIPAGMCIFGYLLCELGTKITFNSVVKAIRKECR